MAKGDFVWCDLSAYRVAEAKDFYANLFDWTYHGLSQPDGTDYQIAATPSGEASAIFEMPKKFQKMELPSFWMPYIAVDDIAAVCRIAQRAGGKLEVGPVAFSETDSIALIRDPLGAGFTAYQGTGLQPRANDAGHGHMVWNALHVSDANAVKGFYEALFGWRYQRIPGTLRVLNAQGRHIADIHQLDAELRGEFEYWGVHFAVADLPTAKAVIKRHGGEIVHEDRSAGTTTTLAKDPGGAAFFIQEAPVADTVVATDGSPTKAPFKWKTILGLAVIFAATVFGLDWVWGVLFLLWTIPALRTGETYFVERLSRRENPILFWITVVLWVALSAYLIVAGLGVFEPPAPS